MAVPFSATSLHQHKLYKGVWREADLSGATFATLTVTYKPQVAADTGASFSVQVSGDGGATWTTVAL